jgi:putative Holliday junction resolvase
VRILALDVGDRRIGLAVSDPLGTIAQPLMTLERTQDVIDRIIGIIKEKEITEIVVGLPINMDGSAGERVTKVREFTGLLSEKTDIPVVYVDERLSTSEAERLMIDADVKRRKRRKVIDGIAAAIILEKRLREISR